MSFVDEPTLLQVIALTIAIVEGIKRIVESFAGVEMPDGGKVLASIVVGSGLAATAEFAPEAWVHVVPILVAGLAAAGLYSIGKRALYAAAVRLNAIAGSKLTIK